MIDNNDGSYSVSYTPEEPGMYSVWVCVKAQHVKVRNHLTLVTNMRMQGIYVKLVLNITQLTFFFLPIRCTFEDSLV